MFCNSLLKFQGGSGGVFILAPLKDVGADTDLMSNLCLLKCK